MMDWYRLLQLYPVSGGQRMYYVLVRLPFEAFPLFLRYVRDELYHALKFSTPSITVQDYQLLPRDVQLYKI